MIVSIQIRFNRRKWVWGGIVFLWALYVIVTLLSNTYSHVGNVDFREYYTAARSIAQGVNPWLAEPRYLYPPLTAMLLLPFVNSTSEQCALLWFALNVLLLIVSVRLAEHHITDERLRMAWWVAPIFFTPTLVSLVHGQATIIM